MFSVMLFSTVFEEERFYRSHSWSVVLLRSEGSYSGCGGVLVVRR